MFLFYSRKYYGVYEEVKKFIVIEMEVGDSDGEEERKVGEVCIRNCMLWQGFLFIVIRMVESY